MRILLTVHQFLPDYCSGTEVLTCSVAKELIGRGHEVRILTAYPVHSSDTLSDDERFDEYLYEGIPVYRFHHAYVPMGGQTSLLELSYDNHLAAAYFTRILSRFKPDVVHFFHLNRLGTGLIDAALAAGIPAYMTPTDFWAICNTAQMILFNGQSCPGPTPHAGNCIKHLAQIQKGGPFASVASWIPDTCMDGIGYLAKNKLLPKSKYEQEVAALSVRLETNVARLNRLQAIVAPNRFMRDMLIKFDVNPKLIIESAYGVDDTKNNVRALLKTARHPLRIGYIGTLARHKGCHILIRAFNTLPAGNALLKIYGNTVDFPGYSAELKSLAGSREDVEFCGVFPNSVIADVMADLDVLVVPSLWYENTPLVVYSAQAAGCPVVASNCPGIASFIHDGENGMLFDAGHVESLTYRLLQLVNEPALIERFSANAKQPKPTSAYVDELLNTWKSI